MGKINTGAIKIGFPFQLQTTKPADDRSDVETFNDLLSDSVLPYIYKYIEVRVHDEDGKKYRWNGEDRTLASNWEPLSTSINGDVTAKQQEAYPFCSQSNLNNFIADIRLVKGFDPKVKYRVQYVDVDEAGEGLTASTFLICEYTGDGEDPNMIRAQNVTFNLGEFTKISDGACEALVYVNNDLQNFTPESESDDGLILKECYSEFVQTTASTTQLSEATTGLQTQIDTINASLADAGALNRDVTAKGVSSILGIEDGTVFSTGLTFSDWFESFMRRYTKPSVQLTATPTTVEVGSTLSTALTATYTQNDGGAVNNVTFTRNGSPIYSGSTGLTYTDSQPVVSGEETVTYEAYVYYDEVAGQVTAGNASASCDVYSTYRIFALTEAEIPTTVDSPYVRSNNKLVDKFKGIESFKLDISGSKYIALVIPPYMEVNLKDTINIRTNEQVFKGITPTPISMNCAGSALCTYQLYVKETPVAWGDDAELKVVLNY